MKTAWQRMKCQERIILTSKSVAALGKVFFGRASATFVWDHARPPLIKGSAISPSYWQILASSIQFSTLSIQFLLLTSVNGADHLRLIVEDDVDAG